MDTVEMLTEALRAIEKAEVPNDLRQVAFGKVIDLLAIGETGDAGGLRRPKASASGGDGRAPTGRLQRVADGLGVPGDAVEMVYMEENDELQIVANPADLGSSNAERVGKVALLLVGGRSLGGWDEGATSDAHVRAEVDRHGLLDPTNYSKHMKATSPWFNINGSGKGATYRMKFAGRQRLKELVSELTSG